MSNRRNGRAWMWATAVVLGWLGCLPETAIAQRGSQPGQSAAPPGASATQAKPAPPKLPYSASQLNQLQPPIPPKTTQAKLQAAMADVETSQQKLKAAAGAMSSYLDKEAVCRARSWTAEDMDKRCSAQDTLQICKEKLVAACAASEGPGRKMLLLQLHGAISNLDSKAKAVGDSVPQYQFNPGPPN